LWSFLIDLYDRENVLNKLNYVPCDISAQNNEQLQQIEQPNTILGLRGGKT
jgi:hypothetical protein